MVGSIWVTDCPEQKGASRMHQKWVVCRKSKDASMPTSYLAIKPHGNHSNFMRLAHSSPASVPYAYQTGIGRGSLEDSKDPTDSIM